MKKIIELIYIKSISYRYYAIISILLLIIGFGLYNFNVKTHFVCKAEFSKDNQENEWYRVNVTVNKYLFNRYTLNDYKLSQCIFLPQKDLFVHDEVFCSEGDKAEKSDSIAFDIHNGRLVDVDSNIWGEFRESLNAGFENQECKKIERGVN